MRAEANNDLTLCFHAGNRSGSPASARRTSIRYHCRSDKLRPKLSSQTLLFNLHRRSALRKCPARSSVTILCRGRMTCGQPRKTGSPRRHGETNGSAASMTRSRRRRNHRFIGKGTPGEPIRRISPCLRVSVVKKRHFRPASPHLPEPVAKVGIQRGFSQLTFAKCRR